jgi:hypothetical protein
MAIGEQVKIFERGLVEQTRGVFNPAFFLDEDEDSYLISPADDVVSFYTAATERLRLTADGGIGLIDGITAPATAAGFGQFYIDQADGNLKFKFGDGFVVTLAADA